MVNQPQLIIIGGPNGVGKTTLAKELIKERKLSFVNADELAADITGWQLVDKARITAGKQFFGLIDRLFQRRGSFVLESTLSGKYLIALIKQARKLGYKIKLIYIFVDTSQICIERINIRIKAGGHKVPQKDIIRRFMRSKKMFWLEYRMLVDEYEMFYNGGEMFSQVLLGVKQEYSVINDGLFRMFKEELHEKEEF